MNAPTTIPPPAVAEYAPIVLRHLPGCFGEQLEMRCRLMLARDTASAARWHCTDAEAVVLEEIVRLGEAYSLATLPTEALEALLKALRHMMQAVSALNRFVDAYSPKPRETDARG